MTRWFPRPAGLAAVLRSVTCVVAGAVFGFLPFSALAAPAYLSVTPVAGKYSRAGSLNEAGQFVVNNSPPEIPYVTASIDSASASESVGGLGGTITTIASINDKGEAVGESTTGEGELHSFLYSSGSTSDLTLLYGPARVNDINNRGEIAAQGPDERAAVIRNGRLEVFGFPNSTARDINEAGDILVEYLQLGGPSRSAIYSQGTFTDLPMREGSSLLEGALNDAGWVSGYGTTSDDRLHAWLYDGKTIADLTPLAANAFAYDVNNLGQVVGTMDNRAFLWDDGQLVDLNSFVDPAADLLLISASDINDHGQILAFSCDRAGVFCYNTVLLDAVPPVPEPPPFLMLLPALAMVWLHRARARPDPRRRPKEELRSPEMR